MNPIERAIRRVDAAQQRHKASAFVFGVIKKYGDDNGAVLAASLPHSGFVSLFPLLLVLVTILGLTASHAPTLRHEGLNALASPVHLFGQQITDNDLNLSARHPVHVLGESCSSCNVLQAIGT